MKNRVSVGFHRVGMLATFAVFIIFTGALCAQLLFNEYANVSIWHFIVVLLACAAVYVVCRMIGWVINGFIKK
ncbi:hypothetical protein CES93_10610 [Citrobacter freundii]|nr:hypothetical protein CES93_10610 [Citrobacter freundii]